jgi:hypothetical protein
VPLKAVIDKFLLGDQSAKTGSVHTEGDNLANPKDHYDWSVPQLSGDL